MRIDREIERGKMGIEEGREGNRNQTKIWKDHTQGLSSSIKYYCKQRKRTGGKGTVWAAPARTSELSELSNPLPSSYSSRTEAASKKA